VLFVDASNPMRPHPTSTASEMAVARPTRPGWHGGRGPHQRV
jgi:hypothetical protein